MNIEKENKIRDIRKLLIKKLHLIDYLDRDSFLDFCNKFTVFLRYDRRNTLLKCSGEQLDEKIDKLLNFFNNIGINRRQIIDILYNNFRLIDSIPTEEFLNKYIFLSVIENKENTVRKGILLNNSRLFQKSLEEFYARYKLCKDSGSDINKNTVVAEGYTKFIRRFVTNKYINYSHQVLLEPISLDKLIKMYPLDMDFIEELKKSDNNKNVSFIKKDRTKEEKIKLAINNYFKVYNLKELSELLNISTSSLQRYLHDDSNKYTSKEEYLKIRDWLSNAKMVGLSTGGKNSQEKYGYFKDENGHFKGNGR